jgi:ketosteroid isomerase-like protein
VNPLHGYLEAWRLADPSAVRDVLDDGCVVVDYQGAVLRGPDAVARSMAAWFGAGGVVHAWRVTEETGAEDVLTAQWVLTCTWQGVEAQIEGRSVARLRDGVITYLREYATSGPLDDWDTTWRR